MPILKVLDFNDACGYLMPVAFFAEHFVFAHVNSALMPKNTVKPTEITRTAIQQPAKIDMRLPLLIYYWT